MPTDVDAGKALGCKTILVTTGPEGRNSFANSPDYIADNLIEAALWITKDADVKNRIIVPVSHAADVSLLAQCHS